jgi:S-DNA-T family DNA segregation ATPase FtsK/SpoIIIE
MPYITEPDAIKSLIDKLALAKILWLDTEIADWSTKNPRLSLIQVSDDPTDLTGDSAFVLDVLDKPDLIAYFVNKIMVNPEIEKLFHNAGFDLKYLGNKQAQNVTCTLKFANKIHLNKLGTANRKLKTLATEICNFSNVDAEEQASDWSRRPLTAKQLQYAKMDVVYLAHVHRRLLELNNHNHPQPVANTSKSENKYFTPTKVRISFECGRLFYLNQHFGGKTLFIPDDNFIGIGKEFHQLAENLANLLKSESRFKDLFAPTANQLIIEETATQMQQLFYELSFFPYLQTAIQANPDKVTALYQIWQALIPLIRRWTELLIKNRRFCSATEVISKTFVESELKVEHWFTLPNGTKQLVRGQFDSLIYDCEHKRLCVVEYKTYQPVDVSAQLAQVALYSYMLWVKKQVPVDSAVYCVAPEFKEYQFSWEDLENTVHKLIPHKLQQMQEWLMWKPQQNNPPPATTQAHLCQICPQQVKCQSFFVVGTPPPIPSHPQGGGQEQGELKSTGIIDDDTPNYSTTINPDVVAEELVNILQSFGIGVDYQGAAVAPAFIRVKLKPQLGVKVVSILNRSADLQVQLGLANPPLIAPQAGFVSVDLPRLDRQVAKFEDYIQRQNLPATAPVKIAMGVNLDGKLIEADLSDPNTCHFLVGGTTGSGKSEFLRSLLLSLLVRHSPNHLKIVLVDPKRVTFPEFEQSSWLYSPIVKESDRAISLMDDLVAEMGKRYQRFEIAKCADINSYNQKVDQPLPRIVCILDEYADFMAEKPTREALELSIKRLGAMARAAGIHLIIATQRPEAKVVTPLIRSNLPGRVALRTASEADSTIILGGKQTEAAYLLGKGDLLYQAGANLLRLQSLLAKNVTLNSN